MTRKTRPKQTGEKRKTAKQRRPSAADGEDRGEIV